MNTPDKGQQQAIVLGAVQLNGFCPKCYLPLQPWGTVVVKLFHGGLGMGTHVACATCYEKFAAPEIKAEPSEKSAAHAYVGEGGCVMIIDGRGLWEQEPSTSADEAPTDDQAQEEQ